MENNVNARPYVSLTPRTKDRENRTKRKENNENAKPYGSVNKVRDSSELS